MENRFAVGNFLFTLRQEKGLTQKELGDLMGVTNKAVSKWKNGTSLPRLNDVQKLSEILGCKPEELLSGRRFSDAGTQTAKESISETRELTDEERRLKELYSAYHQDKGFTGQKNERKFPLAYSGISLILSAKYLSIAAAAVMFIAALISAQTDSFSGFAALSIALAAISVLAAAVMELVGLIKTSKDERSFKSVILFVVISGLITLFFRFTEMRSFYGSEAGTYLRNVFISILGIFETVYFVRGVKYLAPSYEDGDTVTRSGKTVCLIWIIIGSVCAILYFILSIIENAWFTLDETGIAVSGILSLITIALSIAAQVVFILFVRKTKAMLEE